MHYKRRHLFGESVWSVSDVIIIIIIYSFNTVDIRNLYKKKIQSDFNNI